MDAQNYLNKRKGFILMFLVLFFSISMHAQDAICLMEFNDVRMSDTKNLFPTNSNANIQDKTELNTLTHKHCTQSNLPINLETFNQILPNPPGNWLFISSIENIDKMEIISLVGQIVVRKDLTETNSSTAETNLSNGNYIVKLYSKGNLIQTEEIVVHN